MSQLVDISPEVSSLLSKLGVEPANVRSLRVGLDTVRVVAYALDADGRKFADDRGHAALDVLTFPVRVCVI